MVREFCMLKERWIWKAYFFFKRTEGGDLIVGVIEIFIWIIIRGEGGYFFFVIFRVSMIIYVLWLYL